MSWRAQGSYTDAVAVVPADATVIDPHVRALYIGGAGDVIVDMLNSGAVITFKAVPVGTILPIRVLHVRAATTATLILALS